MENTGVSVNRIMWLIVAAMGVGASPAAAEPAHLVRDGAAAGAIVVPEQPSPAELFTAEELQTHLRLMTGAEVPIQKTSAIPAGPAVILGGHPANAALAETLKAKFPIEPGSWKTARHYDAFAAISDGRQLRLVGRAPTALLYAGWDWLESLGVRWIMPGELGRFVPSTKDVALAPLERFEAPALAYRGPNYGMPKKWDFPDSAQAKEHDWEAGPLFSLRMRANCNTSFDPTGRSTGIGSGHSYMYLLPVQKYYQDHPEWFNLVGGKRLKDGPWQICFTNREAAKEFAKNAVASIKTCLDRGELIERIRTSISPNDGRCTCECPECSKLRDSDGSNTSLVTHFANLVTEEIRKTYPQALTYFYAYESYTRPGDHERPGPGLCPEVVFWTAANSARANHCKPMFSDGNDRYRSFFNEFAKSCELITAHEYYGHYAWFTPWPKLTQMACDIPTMARNPKFYGMYSESHLHWGTQGPNFYVQSKLMWDPGLDVAKLMDDYCAAGFGPAGPAVRKYFQALQDGMDNLSYVCGYLVEVPNLLTPQVVQRCTELIDEAQTHLPAMDPGTRWRTELVIQGWRHSEKTAEAVRLFTQSRPKPADRARIVALLQAVRDFADTDQGGWCFERRILRPEIDRILGPLRLDLAALPPGEHVWSAPANHGGAVKFFATIQGFDQGMWGYGLGINRKGELRLPLGAAPGGRLAAATLRLGIGSREGLGLKVRVEAASSGKTVTLAEGLDNCRQPLVLPGELLSAGPVVLSLLAENWGHEPQTVLTSIKLEMRVEPDHAATQPAGTAPAAGR